MYILNNPVETGRLEEPEDYLYSSAKVYAGENGLLKVEEIQFSIQNDKL